MTYTFRQLLLLLYLLLLLTKNAHCLNRNDSTELTLLSDAVLRMACERNLLSRLKRMVESLNCAEKTLEILREKNLKYVAGMIDPLIKSL